MSEWVRNVHVQFLGSNQTLENWLTAIASLLGFLSLVLLIGVPMLSGERLPPEAIYAGVYLMIVSFALCLLVTIIVAVSLVRELLRRR